MATCTLRDSFASNSALSAYTSNSFTPAANDLLILFVAKGSSTNDGTVSDSQSGSWTKIDAAAFRASNDRIVAFVRTAGVSASSMTVTYDCTGDAATRAVMFVWSVDVGVYGASAIRQSAKEENILTAHTPAPTFGSAALTGNPTLGVVGITVNPAGMTPPSGWTEPTSPSGDTGAGSGGTAVGGETVNRDSGFTGTTITWGSEAGFTFGDIIVEIVGTSTTQVTPAVGSLLLSGVAPSIIQAIFATPGGAALLAAGVASVLAAALPVGAAVLALSGETPSLQVISVFVPGVGTLTLAADGPVLLLSLLPDAGALVLDGQASARPYVVEGVTYESTGASPLPGCEVKLFETVTGLLRAVTVSDASGRYRLVVENPEDGVTFQVVAYLVGSPDVAGVTRNTLVGTPG